MRFAVTQLAISEEPTGYAQDTNKRNNSRPPWTNPRGPTKIRSATKPLTITRYEYPVEGKLERMANDLASSFLTDVQACIGWLNTTPGGPFPREMVITMTGNELGMGYQPPAQ